MRDVDAVIERYMAVWNGTDPSKRRGLIEAAWTPGGATIHRLLEARGYDAIVERVAGAADKWVRDGGMVFRPASVLAHNEVVRFAWEMADRTSGRVDSRAQSYLVLDREDRIVCDYQFPMTAPAQDGDHQALAEAYVAFWNAPDRAIRTQMASELWAPCGGHADIHGSQRGLREIIEESDKVVAAFASRGRSFRLDGAVDGHHGAVRFDWLAQDGARSVASGYCLLLLDGDGLIDRAYTFDDPQPRVAARVDGGLAVNA